jgi:hypothetical protein
MILIAGGTGLIGSRLTELLRAHGHTVRILSRSPEGEGAFVWDPAKGTYDAAAFEGVQYLINLAGAGIADKRWTNERKKLIRDSRVDATNTLLKALTETGARPYAYIGASAIGFYGDTGDQWNHENDEAGTTGCMPPVCVDWEKSHQPISSLGIRTVTLRIGDNLHLHCLIRVCKKPCARARFGCSVVGHCRHCGDGAGRVSVFANAYENRTANYEDRKDRSCGEEWLVDASLSLRRENRGWFGRTQGLLSRRIRINRKLD